MKKLIVLLLLLIAFSCEGQVIESPVPPADGTVLVTCRLVQMYKGNENIERMLFDVQIVTGQDGAIGYFTTGDYKIRTSENNVLISAGYKFTYICKQGFKLDITELPYYFAPGEGERYIYGMEYSSYYEYLINLEQ